MQGSTRVVAQVARECPAGTLKRSTTSRPACVEVVRAQADNGKPAAKRFGRKRPFLQRGIGTGAPTLKLGPPVVMDNLGSHKGRSTHIPCRQRSPLVSATRLSRPKHSSPTPLGLAKNPGHEQTFVFWWVPIRFCPGLN